MRKWKLYGALTVACVAGGVALLDGFDVQGRPGVLVSQAQSVLQKIDRRLPDSLPNSLFVMIDGAPAVKPAVPELLAAGAGLRHPYRALWQEKFFAGGVAADSGPFTRVCVKADRRPDCDVRTLAAALAGVHDGQMLVLSPGVYAEAGVLARNSVTIRAEPGARLEGHAAEGKAALVVKGNDTLIEGLECSGIKVSDQNGACIRLEGHNLTLRGVYFHDAQEGLLAGSNRGRLLIEDSLFDHLGEGGRSHGVYMGGGADSALIIRRSHFLHTQNEGHSIKSRAASTLVENCVIASLDSVDSRAIDLPDGGSNIIRANIIEEGVNSSNPDVIGIGLELKADPKDRAAQQSEVVGNLFIIDRSRATLVHARHVPPPAFKGNIVVGGPSTAVSADNYWIRNRGMAGLAPAPGILE